MKAYEGLGQLAPTTNELRDVWWNAMRRIDVNWYQVAVVAVTTFAISMDLMFPPIQVAAGQGLVIYAGHAHMPPVVSGNVQVDYAWLAIELLLIVATAVVGWRIGSPKSERRETTDNPS